MSRRRSRHAVLQEVPQPRLRDRSATKEALDVVAIAVKEHDAVVATVGHIDIAVLVDRHIRRAVEFTLAVTARSDHHQWLAGRAQLLHAVVAPVAHVDAALRVQRDAPRHVELPRIRSSTTATTSQFPAGGLSGSASGSPAYHSRDSDSDLDFIACPPSCCARLRPRATSSSRVKSVSEVSSVNGCKDGPAEHGRSDPGPVGGMSRPPFLARCATGRDAAGRSHELVLSHGRRRRQ